MDSVSERHGAATTEELGPEIEPVQAPKPVVQRAEENRITWIVAPAGAMEDSVAKKSKPFNYKLYNTLTQLPLGDSFDDSSTVIRR